jgi:hypothetical protein
VAGDIAMTPAQAPAANSPLRNDCRPFILDPPKNLPRRFRPMPENNSLYKSMKLVRTALNHQGQTNLMYWQGALSPLHDLQDWRDNPARSKACRGQI